MFIKRRRQTDSMVSYFDEQIEYCAEKMLTLDSDSDEYKKTNDQFLKLIHARDEYSRGRTISPETWALIISNLAGIVLVLHYEQVRVISSKAFTWIVKPKL